MTNRIKVLSRHFTDILPSQSLRMVLKKLNLAQQKQTGTNKAKDTTTQNKCKKLKPALVTMYHVWPKNGMGLFLQLWAVKSSSV